MFGQLTSLGIIVIVVSTSVAFAMEPGSTASDSTPTPIATTVVPEPAAEPEPTAEREPAAVPEPTPAPPPAPANRADCNQIRGTNYLSPEERTWFLANCLAR